MKQKHASLHKIHFHINSPYEESISPIVLQSTSSFQPRFFCNAIFRELIYHEKLVSLDKITIKYIIGNSATYRTKTEKKGTTLFIVNVQQ